MRSSGLTFRRLEIIFKSLKDIFDGDCNNFSISKSLIPFRAAKSFKFFSVKFSSISSCSISFLVVDIVALLV